LTKRKHYVTQWFSGKPVHPGVYERRMFGETPDPSLRWYSRWNGRLWCEGSTDPELAMKRIKPSLNQSTAWRGIAK
jgi:hypothetical protein